MSGIQSTPEDRAAHLGPSWDGGVGWKPPTSGIIIGAGSSPDTSNIIVEAIDRLTEQQRIGNIIARLDSLTHSNPGERLTLTGAELAERLSAQLREVGL